MSSSASPTVSTYHHPSPQATLLSHLSAHLPHSLPLLRRIQFHAQSPSARIFSTLAPGTTPSASQIWSATFVDRSRAPETECWIWSSLESPQARSDDNDTERSLQARSQLLALLQAIKTLGVPDDFAENAPGQSSNTLIVGAVHEIVLSALSGLSTGDLQSGKDGAVEVISGDHAADETPSQTNNAGHVDYSAKDSRKLIRSYTIPWITFLFSIPTTMAPDQRSTENDLLTSHGLEWTTVAETEFELVRSRTSIPRKDRTLRLLPSAGLRRISANGTLVSWAFLGADGSLSSLHVEPEFRGRGLGKVVARRVMRLIGRGLDAEGRGFVGVEGEVEQEDVVLGYSHAAVENLGSRGVARSLGGKESWHAYWVTVNLAVV